MTCPTFDHALQINVCGRTPQLCLSRLQPLRRSGHVVSVNQQQCDIFLQTPRQHRRAECDGHSDRQVDPPRDDDDRHPEGRDRHRSRLRRDGSHAASRVKRRLVTVDRLVRDTEQHHHRDQREERTQNVEHAAPTRCGEWFLGESVVGRMRFSRDWHWSHGRKVEVSISSKSGSGTEKRVGMSRELRRARRKHEERSFQSLRLSSPTELAD